MFGGKFNLTNPFHPKKKIPCLSTEDFLGGLDEPFKKFTNEPGKGQVMLRADDGIHFTQAGLRLISTRLYELIKKQAKP